MRRARLALTVPVILGGLLLTGCAEEAGPADTASAESAATEAAPADDATAEDAADDVVDASGPLTEDNFFDRYVAAMQDAGSYTQTIDMGSEMSYSADVVVKDGVTDMSMTMSGAGDGVSIVFVDGRLFYKIEGMSDKFVEADLDDPEDLMGSSFAGAIDQMDPAESIEAMQDAVTGFTAADETEEIDGATVRRYDIAVDPSLLTGMMQDQAEASGVDLPDSFDYQIWVGVDDDLPRRMEVTAMGVTMVTSMSDFGGDQKVEAPSADEIAAS